MCRQLIQRITNAKSHFEVLQLPTEQVTCETVRQSYLSLVKAVHPDKCGDPDASSAFKRVRESYLALRSPQRRTNHLYSTRRKKNDEFAEALDKMTDFRYVALAVASIITAEIVRLSFPASEQVETRVEPTPEPTRAATVVGVPLTGHTFGELQDRLREHRNTARSTHEKATKKTKNETA